MTAATYSELRDFQNILTNKRGDLMWRFSDGADGKPRFKVFAIEPTHRTQIKNWQDSKPGADYFIGGNYFATDYIIPKKYLKRTASLLGLDLRKTPGKPLTEKQKANYARNAERLRNRRQGCLAL